MGPSRSIRYLLIGKWTFLGGFLVVGCSKPPADPATEAYRTVQQSSGVDRELFGGRVTIRSVYKAQIVTAYQHRELPPQERVPYFVSSVYEPYTDFWSGYLGDESNFRDWMGRQITDLTDPRIRIPLELEFDALLESTVNRMAGLTSREIPHGTWYLVYGPGWTNMGGLGDGAMVVDFFGVPDTASAEGFSNGLPHEINHQLFDAGHADDPDGKTVLYRLIDEGFAVYVNQVYWGELDAPERHLGYTEEEWKWALENEGLILNEVLPLLSNTDRDTHNRFTARNIRIQPEAPGAIGYFIGLRIVLAYVDRHGADSWTDLYDVPVARVLENSLYRVGVLGRASEGPAVVGQAEGPGDLGVRGPRTMPDHRTDPPR